jgi:TonB family protein
VDTYEDTKYADAASNLLQGQGAVKKDPGREQDKTKEDVEFAEAEFDSIAYLDSINQAIEAEIAELFPAPDHPTSTGEFIYPISAYDDLWEGEIKFKILIDFTGKVTDWVILRGSGIKDMDFAASETLKETYFNPADIDPINYGKWLLYRYIIRLPEELRSSRSRE